VRKLAGDLDSRGSLHRLLDERRTGELDIGFCGEAGAELEMIDVCDLSRRDGD